ncbi:MAG: flagellar basal-body rod protein FlgG [Gammaproteobacteria bacterium]
MNPALWTSKTGLDAQQTRLTVISNNLANVNTNGFKRDQAVFQDLMYQNIRQSGGQSSEDTRLPSGMYTGTGVKIVATEKLHTQGNFIQTGNPLDIAIQGRGFFQILKPDGAIAYTRDGSFQIDSNGQVVTASGYPLQPTINIPSNAQSITIGEDGVVTVLAGGATLPTQVGNIQTVDFVNPTGLQPIGNNQFLETASSGSPQTGTPSLNGLGAVTSGALESSNVNVVEELVNMIETQRAYEMNSKVISTTDQMLQYVSNNL